jgi:hypothetical protein
LHEFDASGALLWNVSLPDGVRGCERIARGPSGQVWAEYRVGLEVRLYALDVHGVKTGASVLPATALYDLVADTAAPRAYAYTSQGVRIVDEAAKDVGGWSVDRADSGRLALAPDRILTFAEPGTDPKTLHLLRVALATNQRSDQRIAVDTPLVSVDALTAAPSGDLYLFETRSGGSHWLHRLTSAGQTVWAQSLEYAVKAAYLTKFIPFIQWPDTAFTSPTAPVTICLLGGDPFGASLDKAAGGAKPVDRPITVRHMDQPDPAAPCQLLFIGSGDPATIASALEAMKGRAVVTVPGGHWLTTRVATQGLPSQALVLGVRPENLRVAEQGPLRGRVELVEFLGERTLAHLKLEGGSPLIVTVPAGISPRLGSHVAVSVDVAEAHLFDEAGRAHHAQESLA